MSRESSPLEAAEVICARFIMRATIDTISVMKTPKCHPGRGNYALKHQAIGFRWQWRGTVGQGGLVIKGRNAGAAVKGDKDLV